MRLDGIQRILKELAGMTDCKAEDLANRNLMKFSKVQNYVPRTELSPVLIQTGKQLAKYQKA